MKAQILNIYLNRFFGDFIPVLPLLGLLLLSRDFTISTISLFFLCLAITVIIAEIPAGIIADKNNVRQVVIISRCFKLCAFIALVFAYNVPVLCLAAVLWGLSSAFDSGAIQSYVFQLTRKYKMEGSLERVYGNMFTASLLGLLLAGLVATQVEIISFEVLQYVGIVALGISVLSSFLLPNIEKSYVVNEEDVKQNKIKAIQDFIKLKPLLIILICVGIFAGGIKGSLDEYTNLLFAEKELAFGMIGYIMFGLEILKTTGAAISSRIKLTINFQLLVLSVMGVSFIIASISNYVVAVLALALVILFDAVLWVHNDTAIQKEANDSNRATVASIKNFGTELFAASVFLLVWIFGQDWNITVLYVTGGVVLILASLVLFTHKNVLK